MVVTSCQEPRNWNTFVFPLFFHFNMWSDVCLLVRCSFLFACIWAHVCTHAHEDPGLLGIILDHSSTWFKRQRPSMGQPKAVHYGWSSWLASLLWRFCILTSKAGITGRPPHPVGTYVSFGDLNPSPQACICMNLNH